MAVRETWVLVSRHKLGKLGAPSMAFSSFAEKRDHAVWHVAVGDSAVAGPDPVEPVKKPIETDVEVERVELPKGVDDRMLSDAVHLCRRDHLVPDQPGNLR